MSQITAIASVDTRWEDEDSDTSCQLVSVFYTDDGVTHSRRFVLRTIATQDHPEVVPVPDEVPLHDVYAGYEHWSHPDTPPLRYDVINAFAFIQAAGYFRA